MAMRRTTLGTLSANDMNTRASISGPQTAQKRISLLPPQKQQVTVNKPANRSSSGSSVGQTKPRNSSVGAGRQSISNRQSTSTRLNVAPNNRQSVGRPSTANGFNNSMNRQSFGRRSSAHAVTTGQSDPRPLSDKAFKDEAIERLIIFLAESGYDGGPVSKKNLNAPSNKEFFSIFQHLYRTIDPLYEFSEEAKPEDEIPMLLKNLRYPFTVNKSALFSCGSPHNWPKLLATLVWLLDIIEMVLKTDLSKLIFGQEEDFDDDNIPENEALFDYVTNSYQVFMEGSDEDVHELEEEYAQAFRERNTLIMQEHSLLKVQNEALKRELTQLEATAPNLPSLEQTRTNLRSDKEKFKQLIVQLQAHQSHTRAKHDGIVKEKEKKVAEIKSLEQQKALLENTVATQELSANDVERIREAKQRLQDQLNSLRKANEEKDKYAWKQEIAVSKRFEALDKAAQDYNALGRKLVSLTAGESLEVRINPHGSGDRILTADVKGSIRPRLQDIKVRLHEEMTGYQGSLMQLMTATDTLQEDLSAKLDEVGAIEKKIAAVESNAHSVKDRYEAQLKEKSVELEGIKEEIVRMERLSSNSQAECERILALKKAEYETVKNECAQEQALLNNVLLKLLDRITEHKEVVRDQLSELEAFASSLEH